jgi:hypothetical protein
MKVTRVPPCYYSTQKDMLNREPFTLDEIKIFVSDVERLKSLLFLMDVPRPRKNINYSNILWLSQNLGNKNKNHIKFRAAIGLVRKLMRQKRLFLSEQNLVRR